MTFGDVMAIPENDTWVRFLLIIIKNSYTMMA